MRRNSIDVSPSPNTFDAAIGKRRSPADSISFALAPNASTLPSGWFSVAEAPALDAAVPCITRTDLTGRAARSRPLKPPRLSPSAPLKTFDANSIANFAYGTESNGCATALRSWYCRLPVPAS